MGREKVHIGTSGWHYEHWKGPFYDEDLAEEHFLEFYAGRFHTVEVNNTFYQLPARETLIGWRDSVPDSFVFAVKASRYITHMKKLTDPTEPVTGFLDRIKVLEGKLGPVLFQLPPHWNCDLERLERFLDILPRSYRYVFEFRDPSWFNSQVYEMLAEHGAAFCIYYLGGDPSPKQVTADLVYVRLHGPDGPYKGSYTTEMLAGWAGAFSTWSGQGKDIYCYFNNDPGGNAPRDASRLLDMIGG
jgi:uncharacterized protein YecE (DUF72 family)